MPGGDKMIDIVKCLPSNCCETCDEFILKVDEQAILTENRRIEIVLKVKCKNENSCERANRGMQ